MKIDMEDIKCKFERNKYGDKIIALLTIIVGQFELRGYKVARSKKEAGKFILYPPSVKLSGGYCDIVRVDESNWEEFQGHVLKLFDVWFLSDYTEENVKSPNDQDHMPIDEIVY